MLGYQYAARGDWLRVECRQVADCVDVSLRERSDAQVVEAFTLRRLLLGPDPNAAGRFAEVADVLVGHFSAQERIHLGSPLIALRRAWTKKVRRTSGGRSEVRWRRPYVVAGTPYLS